MKAPGRPAQTCHPQMSNCGLDVEKMDTTFANPKSAHNVHWIKCMDCHQHGVPKSPRRDATRIAQDEVPGMGAKNSGPYPVGPARNLNDYNMEMEPCSRTVPCRPPNCVKVVSQA